MYDVIIIGAGPAGLMAASVINNKKVLLIDKNRIIGKKLQITGGSRCNILNLKEPQDFIKKLPTKNGEFLYHSLNEFSPKDMYNFFKENNVPLKIEDHDRVFPKSNKASDIVNMFNKILTKKNVESALNESVINIELSEKIKEVITDQNKYQTKNIILATGGVTYSYTGSTGDGLKMIEKAGHNITELYPAVVALESNDSIITSKKLQGITLENIVLSLKCNNKKIYEVNDNLLFTHFGLSGPAALKISEFVYHYLKEINPKTMESKIIKGLYFGGEILDLHGFTGGYNITIALATGYIAGTSI
jgi:predicted Rossmann fold flavoprotein